MHTQLRHTGCRRPSLQLIQARMTSGTWTSSQCGPSAWGVSCRGHGGHEPPRQAEARGLPPAHPTRLPVERAHAGGAPGGAGGQPPQRRGCRAPPAGTCCRGGMRLAAGRLASASTRWSLGRVDQGHSSHTRICNLCKMQWGSLGCNIAAWERSDLSLQWAGGSVG